MFGRKVVSQGRWASEGNNQQQLSSLGLLFPLKMEAARSSALSLLCDSQAPHARPQRLTLRLINYTLRHDDVSESGGIAPRILDFGTRWKWLVRFTPGTHWIGGWVGEGKNSLPCWESNLGLAAHRYTDWAIPAFGVVTVTVNSLVTGETLIKLFGALKGVLFTNVDVQITNWSI
jgi:hypothetical protein